MFLTRLDAEIISARGLLAERERELEALRERAADDAETAAQRLLAARREIAALRRALDEAREAARAGLPAVPAAEAEIADARPQAADACEVEPVQPVQAPPQAPSGAPERHERLRRPLRRAVALPIWRLVRPFARPLIWRARTFLTAETTREIAAVRASQDALGAAQDTIHEATRAAIENAARKVVEEALDRVAPPPPAPPPSPPKVVNYGPSHGIGLGDTAAERWLLTAALEMPAQGPA